MLGWLGELLTNANSFSHSFLVYCLVMAAGLWLGRIRFFGFSLGVTCVLFLGLLAGYLGVKVHPEMLSSLRNFGLILFVFFLGLQVGPSFFASFRSGGVRFNLISVAAVVLSLTVMLVIWLALGGSVSLAQMLGVHFGAVTSTPGLGATQEALAALGYQGEDITVGYACAYPLGVLGTVASIIILRRLFKVDIAQEERLWESEETINSPAPIYFHVNVTNKALNGLTLRSIREFVGRPFICSRILHEGTIISPTADTQVFLGDTLRIVADATHKRPIVVFCGEEDTQIDLATEHSSLVSQTISVTREKVNGLRIAELNLNRLDGVNITRVLRAGMTLFPHRSLRLQLGDRVFCVGPKNSVARLAAILGNSEKQLERPNVIAIFVGIAFGLVLGNLPILIPGMPTAVKLGLAGGPLIAAILLSCYGPRLHLVTYTTHSANLMLREWGISFFLASVGLAAGERFFDAVINGNGLLYIALGVIITMVPTLLLGAFARGVLKLNFLSIAGLLAGMSTNTPTLVFANSLSEKSTALIAYSTVYPLTMFLRIISGQLILVLLWGVAM